MKFNSISLAVSLNLIAIALAAPTTTPSQETNNMVDHTAHPLKARDTLGDVTGPVLALVDGALDVTGEGTYTPGTFNPGMDSGATVIASPYSGTGFGPDMGSTTVATLDSGVYPGMDPLADFGSGDNSIGGPGGQF